jgi:signal transduction histidine kinase
MERAGVTLGEVQVVRRHGPRAPRLSDPNVWVLVLPTAILASLLVAFVAMRLLVARLRAMELLAARVAEGDLSVRIGDPRGDEIGRLASQLDRMAERLATARDALEAHEQQRRQLFADITHELATPLTSIRGNAETLLDARVPLSVDDRTRYVRGVLEESRRLDRLIRDLFELARLEAGAAPLQKEPLDWVGLCRNTLERFRPRFETAGLRLVWHDETGSAWIDADGHRIEQVLENLLVNALRYVPANGTVTVTLAVDSASHRPRLTVADDGPGLPDAERAQVFERFYRAGARGADTAREQGGSGLGLAIVREIVQRHGGVARAEANAPHGLAIVVELPGIDGH